MINRTFEDELHEYLCKKLYTFFSSNMNTQIGIPGKAATCIMHQEHSGRCLVNYDYKIGSLSGFHVNFTREGKCEIMAFKKLIEETELREVSIDEDLISLAIDFVCRGIEEHYKKYIRGDEVEDTANERRIKEGFEPIIEKPALPLSRIVRERDYGEKCPECGSSLKMKWFRRTDKCIHPGCSNYFYDLPMFDTSVPMPPVKAPKLTLKDAYVPPAGLKIRDWREAR